MQNLFSNLKVVDLSTVLAGPSVATFFSELGAEVVKIENPKTGGDVTRSWKLPQENAQSKVSAYFSAVNFKKKYVWLDLSNEDDKQAIIELIKSADIVISNFKLGDDKKFGLTSDAIFEINPRIIQAKIKGYSSSPERIAYDVVLQAESGFMFMNGTPDSGPVKMPVALIDVLAAHQLKEGILCALIHRATTGKGSVVECSLEKSALASLVNQATNFLMTGFIPRAQGSLHPNIAPYGEIFYCKDEKPLVLAIGSDKQFQLLCNLIGKSDLPRDDRFSDNKKRVENREALANEILEAFRLKDRAEWIQLFNSEQIPAGAILNMQEVMENKTAQSMLCKESIDGVNTTRLSSIAFTIAES